MVRLDRGSEEKKLIGAVDHWFNGSDETEDTIDDQAAALGITVKGNLTKPPAEYAIWPENQEAVLMFLRCQTQWRAGQSGVIGLDYGVVFQMMALYDVQEQRAVLEDLQTMEGRARELINRAAAHTSKGRR